MKRVLFVLFALSCKSPPTVVVPEADTDTDTDADADADSDSDSDADADVNTIDCNPGAYPTPDPGLAGPPCLTEEIQCGDTIYGTNVGGSTHFGTAAGEQFEQCSGAAFGNDFDGPERVYRLAPSPTIGSIRVEVESCEATQVMYHRSTNTCLDEMVGQCGYLTGGNDFSQHDDIIMSQSGEIIFVIEGLDNDGGNYSITVECFE